jgi:hypothetical protein
MRVSNDTRHHAKDIIHNYAEFDDISECYDLRLRDVPEYEIEKLSCLIYLDSPELAAEACGPDNDEFEKSMLPALIRFLDDTSNKDKQEDYLNAWKAGLTAYTKKIALNLLSDELESFTP